MVQHGLIKTGYRIFTECTRKANGYRKCMRVGTKIRVDLFGDTPLWKVKELLKCRNWKIDCKYGKADLCMTYYIDILAG